MPNGIASPFLPLVVPISVGRHHFFPQMEKSVWGILTWAYRPTLLPSPSAVQVEGDFTSCCTSGNTDV